MTDIKLNHLAIVVDDMETALRFWRESLGLTQAREIQSVPAEAVDIAFLSLGDAHIELILADQRRQRRRKISGQTRTRHAPPLP